MSPMPPAETLKAYHKVIDRFHPLWRLLLSSRRNDSATWEAEAAAIGRLRDLNEEEQAGMRAVISAIGDRHGSINGAAIEPKTCAREHARIFLGIEHRADSKLRELEKLSRSMSERGRPDEPLRNFEDVKPKS